MSIRGYVYVLTNEGLLGLVKVGFSLKDPALRATELSSTGVPHPYVVEYDVLVLNPIEVEQSVHRAFREEGRHEAKEFFRVTVSDAITKINQTIVNQGKTILLENRSAHLQPNGSYSPPFTFSGTSGAPDWNAMLGRMISAQSYSLL